MSNRLHCPWFVPESTAELPAYVILCFGSFNFEIFMPKEHITDRREIWEIMYLESVSITRGSPEGLVWHASIGAFE